jgi:hypothetical protein
MKDKVKKKSDQKPDPQKNTNVPEEGRLGLVPGNEADVTKEDLYALGGKDLSMDLGDDEELNHRVHPVDFSGKDLDIPGAELDDEDEQKGSEDEENNSYSIGGDGNN